LKRGPIWRAFFDPLYVPRWAFVVPVLAGIACATVLGMAKGWQGVAAGAFMGVFLGGVYGGHALLIRWVTRRRKRST
jgi:hypothetical protein